MQTMEITIGEDVFEARIENVQSPRTCSKFRELLPYQQRLIHARWSGEACWIPLGNIDFNLSPESPTSFPSPGEIVVYPGGLSESEILIAYGPVRFASKAGQLAGNPLATITRDLDRLAQVGREILWGGAREIVFRAGHPA